MVRSIAFCSYRIAGDWLTYLVVLERSDLAYTPRAQTLHRRHATGVTIGSDNLAHLREVLRMQAFIAATHPVSESTQAQARVYAERLRGQFGLLDADVSAGSGRRGGGDHVDQA